MEKTEKPTGKIIKVGVTGPESSGKTWMARNLSERFQEPWLPEYAREYLNIHGPSYTIEDLYHIATEQLKREKLYAGKAAQLLFCDTDVIVLKVWFKYKFNVVPEFIEEALRAKTYGTHLLMRPDLPYEFDELRENPEKGDYFFDIFLREIEENGLDYVIIDGTGTERLKKAEVHIRQLLNSTPA